MADKYQVTDLDGEYVTRLNQRLAAKQGVTDDELHALRASHQLRFYLFQIANANKDHPLTLQMLARLFKPDMPLLRVGAFIPNSKPAGALTGPPVEPAAA